MHPLVACAMDMDWSKAPDDEAEIRQLRATYYGMMTEVDDQIGRLLRALDERGLTDNTIVVLTSDHGEMLGDHRLMSKLGYFDQSFHIPLLIRAPGMVAGDVVDEFTENVDVMPTILDLMDLPVPRQCQGRSLTGFLAGESPTDWRSSVHWEFDFRLFARVIQPTVPLELANLTVHRTKTEKYVHFAGMPSLFFDLVEDPDQLTNLAVDPNSTDRMLAAAEAMLTWRQGTSEQLLTNRVATDSGMRNLHQPPDITSDWRSHI